MYANMRFNTESYNVRQIIIESEKMSRSEDFIGLNSE